MTAMQAYGRHYRIDPAEVDMWNLKKRAKRMKEKTQTPEILKDIMKD